jgi:hypothetical protein
VCRCTGPVITPPRPRSSAAAMAYMQHPRFTYWKGPAVHQDYLHRLCCTSFAPQHAWKRLAAACCSSLGRVADLHLLPAAFVLSSYIPVHCTLLWQNGCAVFELPWQIWQMPP